MHRRALLAGVAGLGATSVGALSAPALPRRVEPPFAVTEFSATAEKAVPTHRFAVSSVGAYGRERALEETSPDRIVRVDVLPPAVARLVRRAIANDTVKLDSLPEGFRETLARYDVFVTDSTDDQNHYGVFLHELDPDAPSPLEFDATLVDGAVTDDDPGVVEFAVRNVGERTQRISTGPTPPFDLLRAEAVRGPRQFLLWTDYEKSSITADHVAYNHWLILQSVAVPPGERRTHRYELRANTADEEPGPGLGPGTFRVEDGLSFSDDPFVSTATRSVLAFGVEFTVERA